MEPYVQPCHCPLRPGMTKEELLEEIYIPQKNCCHPHYVCPSLDRELRRADKENQWRSYQGKGPKKQATSKVDNVVSFDELNLT